MIRVLHVMSSIGTPGGVQSVVWNYYSHMDHERIVFDIASHGKTMQGFEKHFLDTGSQLFYVPPKKEGLRAHFRAFRKIFAENRYDIVHVHQDFLGYTALFAAWRAGVPTRIAHSHKYMPDESFSKAVRHKVFVRIIKWLATDFYTGSEASGRWTFGNRFFDKGRVKILHNAIEPGVFRYNEDVRDEVRKELSLENRFVVGNVARFTWVKNHAFMLDVFAVLVEKVPEAVLLLAGDGELLEDMKQRAASRGLADRVRFLGARKDAGRLYQAMDAFLLPSFGEGQGVVLVEARCADLPCVASDRVPREVEVDGKIAYLSLNAEKEDWCGALLAHRDEKRKDMTHLVREAGYDIEIEAQKLLEYYEKKAKHL